jgi:hypothetical protein
MINHNLLRFALAGGISLCATVAQANLINVFDPAQAGVQIGTLSCTASDGNDPACQGFTGVGQLSDDSANTITGTPPPGSSPTREIGQLNTLINVGTFPVTAYNFTAGTGGAQSTSIFGEYFWIKLGDALRYAYFKNVDTTLDITWTPVDGQGAGSSHIAQTPIPGALLLLLTGIAGLFGWRRLGGGAEPQPA